VHDEELAASAVGIARTSHAEHSAKVLELAELGFDAESVAADIDWATGSPEVGGIEFSAVRVATLDHESRDASVKPSSVVEAFFAEFDEVGDMVWRDLGEEHCRDLAFGRFDDGDIITFDGFDHFLIEIDRDEFLALRSQSQGEKSGNHNFLFYLTGHFSIVAFLRTTAFSGGTEPLSAGLDEPVLTISSTTSIPFTIFPNEV